MCTIGDGYQKTIEDLLSFLHLSLGKGLKLQYFQVHHNAVDLNLRPISLVNEDSDKFSKTQI